MFSKNEKAPESTVTPSPAAPAGDKSSLISSDLEVTGDLKSDGDVKIDGRVKGDVRSRSVFVSSGAVIEGSIFAQDVKISGRVQGQIEAPKVTVLRNAEVIGDILHEILEVESGAQFQGACRRLERGASQLKPTQKPAA